MRRSFVIFCRISSSGAILNTEQRLFKETMEEKKFDRFQIGIFAKSHFDKWHVKIGLNQRKFVKARFNGKCVECGGEIKVGKEIIKNSKEKWVHKACSDLEDELP